MREMGVSSFLLERDIKLGEKAHTMINCDGYQKRKIKNTKGSILLAVAYWAGERV